MTCLTWSISYKVGVCESARPYMDRIAARPAYQQALIVNRPPA
jgi:glutathione S-transferase